MEKKYLLFDKADSFVKKIYRFTLKFPQKYQFSIGEQLRRASLSIILNIVEAGARKSIKENRHLLSIAFGSLKETKYLLYFSNELSLITGNELHDVLLQVNELARILYGILYKNK